MDKSVWKEAIRKDAYKKVVGSRDRCKRGVCAKKGKGVSVVKGGERRGERIRKETVAERLHLAVEVTTNSTSIFCREEGWEEEDGARLLISQ